MKTLTKKFRAIVFDGVVQAGWQDEQTGETLVSDSTQAFEADTLDELSTALKTSGCDLTNTANELQVPQSPASSSFPAWRQL